MDFFRRKCKDLCERLLDERISNENDLNEFVKKSCSEFEKDKAKVEKVIDSEKKVLKPLHEYFNKRDNNLNYIKFDMLSKLQNPNTNDIEIMQQYIFYLKNLKEILEKLGKKSNVKFFSIFLGIGTGKYYRNAAKKLNNKINNCDKKLKIQKRKLTSTMFKGLPNNENYCYLNALIQQLHTLDEFRKKVLNSDPPHPDKNGDFKELYSVKFFFSYLDDEISEEQFKKERKKMAQNLGYNGYQQDSGEKMGYIQTKCREQLRKLKGKSDAKKPSESINNLDQINLRLEKNSSTLQELFIKWVNEDGTNNGQKVIQLKVKSDNLVVINITRTNKQSEITDLQETMTIDLAGHNGIYKVNKFFKQCNTDCLIHKFKLSLQSATIHRGDTGSGHYYVYKKVSGKNKWKEINDSSVTEVLWSKIEDDIRKNATVLICKLTQC